MLNLEKFKYLLCAGVLVNHVSAMDCENDDYNKLANKMLQAFDVNSLFDVDNNTEEYFNIEDIDWAIKLSKEDFTSLIAELNANTYTDFNIKNIYSAIKLSDKDFTSLIAELNANEVIDKNENSIDLLSFLLLEQ